MNIINKPEDRLAGANVGDKVAYWHWCVGPDGYRTGKAVRPRDGHGRESKEIFVGVVEILTAETVQQRQGHGEHGSVGEKVIRLLDDAGNPTDHYERISHLPPEHTSDAFTCLEDEVQNWYLVGVDPNKP